MSTDDSVRQDYGLTDEAPASGGKERRIWETTSVSPDPHMSGHFYAVQRLAGEWKRVAGQEEVNAELGINLQHPDTVVWFPRDPGHPPVTRVLYCTMDEYGKMVNVYRDASQGKSPKIDVYVDAVPQGTWRPNELRTHLGLSNGGMA